MSKDKFEEYLIDRYQMYERRVRSENNIVKSKSAKEAARALGAARTKYAKVQQARMKSTKIWLAVIAVELVIIFLLGSCAAQASSSGSGMQLTKVRSHKTYEFYEKRTVRILKRNVQIGSGSAIGPKLILTAAHVCDRLPDAVSTPGARYNRIMTIASGNARLIDVCMLRVRDLHRAPEVVLADDFNVRLGQRVALSGYTRDSLYVLSGLIVEIGPLGKFFSAGPSRLYRINKRAYPGQSGGPVFNTKGELVGIVTAMVRDQYVYHMLFTSIREIRAFYTRMGFGK